MSRDERLNEIWSRTVVALREVVTELKITEDELHLAGRYFNRLGQSGMFPSLLDVALAMTSIDATRQDVGGTRPNLEGPYYMPDAPLRATGILFDKAAGPEATFLTLSGRVVDSTTGEGIVGAEIDIWHADEKGFYDRGGFYLRGVVRTDESGGYTLCTVIPNDYSEHDHDPIGELFRALGQDNHRAAHIHVKIRVDGAEVLMTQLFIPHSKCLYDDYVVGAVSEDLVLKLAAEPVAAGQPPQFSAQFDFAIARRSAAEAAE
jgi:protocatechuate 3,4-dioxygenase beta subunit